jgi:hypothetical protein
VVRLLSEPPVVERLPGCHVPNKRSQASVAKFLDLFLVSLGASVDFAKDLGEIAAVTPALESAALQTASTYKRSFNAFTHAGTCQRL